MPPPPPLYLTVKIALIFLKKNHIWVPTKTYLALEPQVANHYIRGTLGSLGCKVEIPPLFKNVSELELRKRSYGRELKAIKM